MDSRVKHYQMLLLTEQNRGSQINEDAANSWRCMFTAPRVPLLQTTARLLFFFRKKNKFQDHVQRNLGNALYLQILKSHYNSSHRCTLDKKYLWKSSDFYLFSKVANIWVSCGLVHILAGKCMQKYVLKKQLSDSCQAANMDISLVKFGHPVGFLHVILNT